MAAAGGAGTLAGWPLGPEYLSSWNVNRESELVVATLDLTKAGCDYWQQASTAHIPAPPGLWR